MSDGLSKGRKLVKGWGINDANYRVHELECYYEDGKRKFKSLWKCPYYTKWISVLARSFSDAYLKHKPSYVDVTTSEDWRHFSKFKAWMEAQEWQGLQLDKDILVKGNKEYGPNTCVFVPAYLNMCIVTSSKTVSDLPIGVTRASKNKKMINEHSNPHNARIGRGDGRNISLGSYPTPKLAHQAWQRAKISQLEGVINRYYKESCFNTHVADSIMSRVWDLQLDLLNSRETKSL